MFFFMTYYYFILRGVHSIIRRNISMKRLVTTIALTSLFLLFAGAVSAASPPFKAAVVQFNPILNERDKNIEALAAAFEEAMKNGAKLVVAPEMSTTGYHYDNRAAIAPFVDAIPGKATDVFSKLTAKYGAYVVFGMPEVDRKTKLYYNSSALVGPEGCIGSYRKTHLWETEEHWASYGDLGVPVYNTSLGRIAINICMDSAYFESARLAALAGADILAFPTNSTSQAIAALPARAVQNGLYIVSANRSNTEREFHMIGGSAVWSPEGDCLTATPLVMNSEQDENGTTIAYADINPAQYENAGKALLKSRRPELYKDLMLHIAPWNYQKSTKSAVVLAFVLQYNPIPAERERNMEKISKLVDAEIKNSGKPDLIVLPEMPLTGPGAFANKADLQFFSAMASKHGAYLVGSYVEDDNGKSFITAVLFDRKGNEAGRYRKTHLNSAEKKWAAAGNSIGVFTTDIGRIGIVIGDEVKFPEVAGLLAILRADIIAVPSSWKKSDGGEWRLPAEISANRYPEGSMVLWDSTAMSAQAYTLISNFSGDGFFGGSGLYTLDPLYGLDQPSVLKEGEGAYPVKFSTLQSQWWFNQEMLINSRRSTYYIPLVME
jgi:predicted amidohydrolase